MKETEKNKNSELLPEEQLETVVGGTADARDEDDRNNNRRPPKSGGKGLKLL